MTTQEEKRMQRLDVFMNKALIDAGFTRQEIVKWLYWIAPKFQREVSSP